MDGEDPGISLLDVTGEAGHSRCKHTDSGIDRCINCIQRKIYLYIERDRERYILSLLYILDSEEEA